MSSTQTRSFRPADLERAGQMSADEAIRYHYDNDTQFFALWLDPTLSYSSGRWRVPPSTQGAAEDLAGAQRAKIDFHLDAVALPPGGSLIDVGCGWGGVLTAAVERHGAGSALGLTLSADQHDHLRALAVPGVEVALQDVFALDTDRRFDAAVSVGAFEHFARPDMDRAEKVATYHAFFARMHAILQPGARLSLQTIVWDGLSFEEARAWIKKTPQTIFPLANVPFLSEVADGSAEHFRLVYLENDPRDYALTLSAWIRNLRAARERIVGEWGEGKFDFFQRYLRYSRLAFQSGELSLARFVLQRR